MADLNQAAIRLNQIWAEAKTSQQRHRARQYASIYRAKLDEANNNSWKTDRWFLLGLAVISGAGTYVTLYAVSQGWIK